MPPQVLKQQVRTLAANQDIQALREGGLQPFGAKLPVLQAFQEFLDLERRRARKRLLRMALFLVALLVAVLVAAVWYVGRLSGRVDREVSQLEKALAVAREEAGSLRGDAEAMRQSLADAQNALARLRKRFDSVAVFAGAAPDLTAISGALDILQLIQFTRADQVEMESHANRLQAESDQLVLDRQAEREYATRMRLARKELARDVKEFSARRRELESRLSELAATAGSRPARSLSEPMQRGSSRKRKDAEAAPQPVAPPKPDPALVSRLLEDIYRLRFEQTLLKTREVALARDVAEWKALRSALAGREETLLRRVEELNQRMAEFQGHHQSIQARLADLQKTPVRPNPSLN